MPRSSAALVLAAALCLAGCATARELPPPMTQAEVKALVAEQNLRWWNEMFPDEPQPHIEPIAFVDPTTDAGRTQRCIIEANIEGVEQIENGWTFSGDDQASQNAFQLAVYTCSMQYPYSYEHPEAMGYFSRAQLEYLYDYYATRLYPCLRANGYSTSPPPDRDSFVAQGLMWVPYWDLEGPRMTEEEWAYLDLKCPPPPLGPTHSGGF